MWNLKFIDCNLFWLFVRAVDPACEQNSVFEVYTTS